MRMMMLSHVFHCHHLRGRVDLPPLFSLHCCLRNYCYRCQHPCCCLSPCYCLRYCCDYCPRRRCCSCCFWCCCSYLPHRCCCLAQLLMSGTLSCAFRNIHPPTYSIAATATSTATSDAGAQAVGGKRLCVDVVLPAGSEE
jgi:hypothetical protein